MGLENSLNNGKSDVSVTENFGQRVQKVVSEESSGKRRCSPRLRGIPEGKKPYYGPPRNSTRLTLVLVLMLRVKIRHKCLKRTMLLAQSQRAKSNHPLNESGSPNLSKSEPETVDAAASAIVSEEKSLEWGTPYVAHTRSGKAKVKETLRIYNKYYFTLFRKMVHVKMMVSNLQSILIRRLLRKRMHTELMVSDLPSVLI